MPQIGWFEILLIAAIAIIIIGPKDFPVMLKKIGSWIGTIKRYFSTLQKEVSLYENENFDTDDSKKKKR
jgi:sec-independent protein translocase protein TatB